MTQEERLELNNKIQEHTETLFKLIANAAKEGEPVLLVHCSAIPRKIDPENGISFATGSGLMLSSKELFMDGLKDLFIHAPEESILDAIKVLNDVLKEKQNGAETPKFKVPLSKGGTA